jgi:hypothetical protein
MLRKVTAQEIATLTPVIGTRAARSAVMGSHRGLGAGLLGIIVGGPVLLWADVGGPRILWLPAAPFLLLALFGLGYTVVVGRRSVSEASEFVSQGLGYPIQLKTAWGARVDSWERDIQQAQARHDALVGRHDDA